MTRTRSPPLLVLFLVALLCDNLVQDTRRGQWFTEASWDTEGGWHIGAEVLLARSEAPSWQTSPSYPPNKVVDPTRSVRANNPGLIDMARLYPDLYGPYAFCDAPYCGWQGDGGAQDAAGFDPARQEVAWIRGRMFGQDGPLRGHIRESETERCLRSRATRRSAAGGTLRRQRRTPAPGLAS